VVSYKTLNPKGASKRATEACSAARDAPPRPASLAPNAETGADGGIAGPSVLNPQAAVMGGKQQSKRHRGAHEGKGKFAAAKPAAAAAGKRARKAPAAPH